MASVLLLLTTLLAAAAHATPAGCHPRKGCDGGEQGGTDPTHLAITNPTHGDEAKAPGDITVRGEVGAGLHRVDVSLAGVSRAASVSEGTWHVALPLGDISPGPYRLTADARGPRGARASATVEVTVVVAVEPPQDDAGGQGDEPSPQMEDNLLFSDRFDRVDGLITNEFAFWNPRHAEAVHSPDWEMRSGSAFVDGGTAWTGRPDNVAPDATSSNGTNSAVFRLVTKRSDFGDVNVSFELQTDGYVATSTTPAVAWDGVHVLLRYQSPQELYHVSIDRRDDQVVVKKKVPGGTSNGGTYYTLATGQLKNTAGVWRRFDASVVTHPNGSVTISLDADGRTVLTATDLGVGGPPITAAGAVGVRGDNTEFRFRDFRVTSRS